MSISFAKNIAWFFLEHGVKTLVGLASTLIMINYLMPSGYGVLALSFTTFAVLSAFTSLGLDSVLLKKLIEVKSIRLVRDSIILRLYASVFITFIIIFLAQYTDKVWLTLLCFLLIILYFDSFLAMREYYFSEKKYKVIVLANVYASVSQLFLVLLIVLNNLEFYWLVLPFVLNRLVFISILVNKFEHTCGFFQKKNIGYNLSLLQEGTPLMFAAMGGLIYAAQDQWMLAYFLSETEVGVYAAATKLVLISLVLPTILTNLLYHKIIALKGDVAYISYIKSLYAILFYVGVGVYIVILLVSDLVVEVAFPEEYSTAAEVLVIYSLVLLMAFFQSLNNKLLILEGLQKMIMTRVILSVIVNFMLNIYMIPKYGLQGAAYATVLSELFILLSYSVNKQTRHIFFNQFSALNPFNMLLIKNTQK